ncbi:hypothetical protein KC349_g174 [Hortaea werneckii]|nr:hypothetical protein KC349_g174 [Hortaea werneckii]
MKSLSSRSVFMRSREGREARDFLSRQCCNQIRTCKVGSVTKLNKDLESQDTYHRDHKSDREHQHDKELFTLVQLKLREKRQWQRDNYNKSNPVAEAASHSHPTRDLEPSVREDSEVKAEHGHFDDRECRQVEVFVEVVDLQDSSDVLEGYFPDVLAESKKRP